jgi:hypothetical protein
MRISEKTRTANAPITVVNGVKLAKNPVNGTSISAKPDKIPAKYKKIQLFMVTPPFTNNICPKGMWSLMIMPIKE